MDSSKKVLVIPHPEYNDYLPKIRKEDAIKKIGLDKNKKTILFFGLIRPYKGLDLLIKAFSMLPNDYQLIIAGEVYGKKDKYEQLIDNSKNKNILFTNDFIPENEVHIYFSSADLCVLPYISGTQSGVKAIADYFKVPSLVSNVGGLVEEIQDKKNGFIIHELNEFSISNQIEEIFQNFKKWMPNDTSSGFQKNNPNTWNDFAERVLNFCSQ